MTYYIGPPPGQDKVAAARSKDADLVEAAAHQRQVREAKASPGRRSGRSVAARIWRMITGR